jgi:homocysteine S-methyltransferase
MFQSLTLPQCADAIFLTDGGIETTLIFHDGLDLPHFAAFHLLRTAEGEAALRRYFGRYATLAVRYRTGLVLESATWRANGDWGAKLGYSASALAAANRHAIGLLEDIRATWPADGQPVVISGCVGPRGDGYAVGRTMSAKAAMAYHQPQIDAFAGTTADMVCAHTMTYAAEAIGITRAARRAGLPVAISFTVETDGRLPSGQTLGNAVEEVDAATSRYPSYFMINCAHPSHFKRPLLAGGPWVARIRGLRANASRLSHAALNDLPTLDAGNPLELGFEYASLLQQLPQLSVLGGCCGTDHRHLEEIARACAGKPEPDRQSALPANQAAGSPTPSM